MKNNLQFHNRQSIRLKGYDYSQAGLYFITICEHNNLCLFGKVSNGKMILNNAGQMIYDEWIDLQKRFQNIRLHEFIVMPNHFHGILEIISVSNNEKQETLGKMIGAFKSICTVKYIDGVDNHNWQEFNGKLWQRDFYDHIIRNKKSHQKISEYIINNPLNWEEDEYFMK